MQYVKERKGVAKVVKKGEKDFDLDRKRDDESIIDVESLRDPDYQVNKKQITFFDTGDIPLLMQVDAATSSSQWENEGEVHLKLPKHIDNKAKYWRRLALTQVPKDPKMQVWWDMEAEHADIVKDLAYDERKLGLHKDEL